MNDPKFLTKLSNQKKIIDYDSLVSEGISLIQRFSGNKWTDYNYHDPGITFLEQLCYALTDLGYRSGFDLEDILFFKKDNFDIENENLLIPLNKILTSSPLTINDYRKLIIEKVDNIKNVWIEIIKDNSMGLNGLMSVSIQCNEDISEIETLNTKNKVYDLLMNYRTISTDFEKIKVLKKEKIEISAVIKLDPFALGEAVLAEIYYKIDKLLNPEIIFNDFEKMKELGYSDDHIYSGPESKYGYIDEKTLIHKTNSIYSIELIELIDEIKGVEEIVEIKFFKNGIQIFDDLISFNENSYPFLRKTILDYNEVNEKIVFFRNDSPYGLDSVILSQLYDSMILDSKPVYKKNLAENYFSKINPKFEKEEVEKYYSIQNELPSIYGLKVNEIPKDANKKRKAQVKQLKSYLYFFEQIMSNYLSQLANIRNFFSINDENHSFYQIPYDIPDLDIVIDKKNLKKLIDLHSNVNSNTHQNVNKKDKILNHLLSRFNEEFDTTILSKVSILYDESFSKEKLLKAKIKYSNNVVELGKEVNKGFNYSTPVLKNNNSSGFEKRIKLLLDIKNINSKSLTFDVNKNSNNSNDKMIWSEIKLASEDGIVLDVYSLNEKKYSSKESFFYSENLQDFNSLFVYGMKKKSYKIIKTLKKTKYKFDVLYNSPLLNKPVRIFSSQKKDNCLDIINKSIEKIKSLNNLSEGFHIIEHILLRPSSIVNYKNFVYNDKEELILESFEDSDFDSQKDIRSDLYLNSNSKENFVIQKNRNSSKYSVTLLNSLKQPVLVSTKEFKTINDANEFVDLLFNFFKIKKQRSLPVENFSKIKIDFNRFNEFPSNFTYSNKISIVCPNWPARFQNMEFISLFKSYVKKFLPLHISFQFFMLDLKSMSNFEKIYFNWLNLKSTKSDDLDNYSIQLIQLLNNYNE